MYWVVDVLVIAFLAVMLARGIKRGFINGAFTFVTTFLWIGLAAGFSAGCCYLFTLFGWMQDIQLLFLEFGNDIGGLVGMDGLTVALYCAYALVGVILFIPCYVLSLWIGRQFERFVKFVRSKVGFFRVLGSILGGLVNFAVAAALVLVVFGIAALVDGSGLFSYTNEVLRAAPLSGWLYEINPLCTLLGGHGALAEDIAYIISGAFLYA
ncbi:MAG: hypothetical protein IJW13_04750 [Clostridia bacterium]|nr:hypothetical protein [Clostridia bacterium]